MTPLRPLSRFGHRFPHPDSGVASCLSIRAPESLPELRIRQIFLELRPFFPRAPFRTAMHQSKGCGCDARQPSCICSCGTYPKDRFPASRVPGPFMTLITVFDLSEQAQMVLLAALAHGQGRGTEDLKLAVPCPMVFSSFGKRWKARTGTHYSGVVLQ